MVVSQPSEVGVVVGASSAVAAGAAAPATTASAAASTASSTSVVGVVVVAVPLGPPAVVEVGHAVLLVQRARGSLRT